MDFSIVGLGEVLWDLLLTGPKLGGAPANFAYHAHALGANAKAISRVGDDEYGHEIIRRFGAMDLPAATVQLDRASPTGTVKVELSGDGLAHFTIQENVAWDSIAATPDAIDVASSADAICFGSLAQRCAASRAAIQALVAAARLDALRVFDINIRQHFYSRSVIEKSLRLSNVLKFSLTGSAEQKIQRLAEEFNLSLVALTRGPKGSLLYQTDLNNKERWSDCRSHPVKVVDTVGAGDSFTAALVLGLLRKMDLDEINEIANEVARYVCSQPGAMPIMPEEFARRFALTSQ
jgi:fructokinase